MLAANKRRHRNPAPAHRKYHAKRRYRNPAPVHRRIHYKRRRNPSKGLFSGGNPLKELMSLEGAMMIGAAFAAPMAADYIQSLVMPSATGYTQIAVKAAIIGAGTWAIAKFLKKNKVALAFGVTGAAVLAADALAVYQGVGQAGLSGNYNTAAMFQRQQLAGYSSGLADVGYSMGLASSDMDAFPNSFRNAYT
jgi:hypothetical protein